MTQPPARFEDAPALHVAGLRAIHPFNRAPGDIPAQWMRFVPYLPLPGQAGNVSYGVMGPATEPQTFFYVCAVEVSGDAPMPDGIERLDVSAGHYAVFAHAGHVSAFSQTIASAYGWLRTSSHRPADGPALERYGEAFDPRSGMGGMEFWMPVVKS